MVVRAKKILVTGGTGYIGSHTVVQLLLAGYDVVVLDNLINSNKKVIQRIEKIASKKLDFICIDLLNIKKIDKICSKNNFEAVIHFAGLKSVSESESFPIKYFQNNIAGSINLIEALVRHSIKKIIFSSSATIYGDPGYPKCTENTPANPNNVYGQTKLITEQLLRSVSNKDPEFKHAILRYFNPAGAHPSGLIGEDPTGIPNNLVPYISQVAVGRREKLIVYGNDYPTSDGTGRRDYIHVEDLAAGHLAALSKLEDGSESFTVNLGTGNSHSVLEVVDEFKLVTGTDIPLEIASRRKGDVAENYADATLANNFLNWKAERDLRKICEDTWRWQCMNPNGY